MKLTKEEALKRFKNALNRKKDWEEKFEAKYADVTNLYTTAQSISNQNKLHASYDPDVKNTTLVIVDDFELTAQMLTEDKQYSEVTKRQSYTKNGNFQFFLFF